jgi:heme/copper-type cytochrome/quinol oxidase subunit 3
MESALNNRTKQMAGPSPAEEAERLAAQRKRNGLLGIGFFIASESMFFLGLFLAYFYLRATTQIWPPEGVTVPGITLALVNTLVALLSTIAVIYAGRAIARDNRKGLVAGMSVAAALGVVFMAIQSTEFAQLSVLAQASAYGSTFTFLLLFHVLRVFAGVVLMGVVLVRALMGQFNRERRLMVQATVMYWIFITGVWLVVLYVLYFVK